MKRMMCGKQRSHPVADSVVTVAVKLSFCVSVFVLLHIRQVTAHTFIYGGCSQSKFDPNSVYLTNLNSLLSSLSVSASQSTYTGLSIGTNDSSLPNDAPIFGLYQCRGDLSTRDCADCVQNAIGQLGLICSNSFAAVLQLDGCFIRYDNVDFLGKPDLTILYKKCSQNTNIDGEFLRRRDDILGDLQEGTGFRVSGSGSVEGFAQCVGDLGSNDCSSCLNEAVRNLRNLCGSAVYADVYLAQCYARYWASGYYSNSSNDSSDEDDIGRTVAIIVGVLAGLALIVVFLSFLRRTMG